MAAITINQNMLNQIIDDKSDRWDDYYITYSIDVDYGNIIQDSSNFLDFTFDPNVVPTSDHNMTIIPQIITLWDDVIAKDIKFVPGDEDANITIETATNFDSKVGGSTYNTIHSPLPNDADVFLKTTDADYNIDGNNRYQWSTVLHEFGHALGLQHPGEYNASDGDTSPTYANDRSFDEDTLQFTVMSYFNPDNYDPAINWDGNKSPQTPMVYDILAIQAYYGVDTTTRLGDTTYGFNSTAGNEVYDFTKNPNPVLTIWDAGGDHDRLDVSGYTNDQRIDLTAGSYSDIGGLINNVAIAFGVTIEDAVGGSGNDTITGNTANNHLIGGDGKDTINGGGGTDILEGDGGDDILEGNGTLDGGADNDILRGDGILIGGTGNDKLYGGSLADVLQGGDDNDELYGGLGGDALDGGKGDDLLDGGFADPAVPDVLTGGEGADTFVYKSRYLQNIVTDFKAGEDKLDLTGTNVHDFYTLLSKATQVGDDVVFTFATYQSGAKDQLILQNVKIDDLDPSAVLFSEDETILPPSFQLTSNPGLTPYYLTVAPIADGGFLAVEHSYNNPYNLVGYKYDEHLNKSSETFNINTAPTSAGTFVAEPLGSGRDLIVWIANISSAQNEIRGRIIETDGTPIGGDFVVNTTPALVTQGGFPSLFWLSAFTTANGEVVVRWAGVTTWPTNYTEGYNNNSLFEQTFDANGNPVPQDQNLGPLPSPSDYQPNDADQYLTLSTGNTIHYWLATGSDNILHLYVASNLDPTPIQLDNGDVFGVPHAIELSDHSVLFSFGTGGRSGFSQYFTGSDVAILNPDLKGFTIFGTDDADTLSGTPRNDRLYGRGGNDTLQGGAGGDLLDGGEGNDTVTYAKSLHGVSVDLENTGPQLSVGHAHGDILVSIENLTGSAYDDELAGDSGPNRIDGSYGDDVIKGNGGLDMLYGGAGNDTITLTFDTLDSTQPEAHGGKGDDKITLEGIGGYAYGEAGDDSFYLHGANGFASGGDGEDDFFISGSGNQSYGGEGRDFFSVTSGTGNIEYGQGGNDVFRGGDEDDTFYGGADDDRYVMSKGNDFIYDESGANDKLEFNDLIEAYDIEYDPQMDLFVFTKVDSPTDKTTAYGIDIFTFYEGGSERDYTADQLKSIAHVLNHTPITAADTYDVAKGSRLVSYSAKGLLSNDYDQDGEPLKVSLGHGPAHGTLDLNPDGSFVYTPDIGFEGTDSFTYLATDGVKTSEPTAVELNVQPLHEGRVVDGYLWSALVFQDTDGNGFVSLDSEGNATEPYAYTNSTGHFSLYGGSGPILEFGGFDIGSNIYFNGIMAAPAGSTIVSPLTTLMVELGKQGATDPGHEIADTFHINPAIDLTTFDPVAETAKGSSDAAAVFRAGIEVSNTLVDVAGFVAGITQGDSFAAYQAALHELTALIAQGTPDLTDPATIHQLIVATLDGQPADDDAITGAAQIIAELNQSAEDTSGLTGHDALTALTAIQITAQNEVVRALYQAQGNPTQVETLVQNYTGDALNTRIAANISNVGDVDGSTYMSPPNVQDDLYKVAPDHTIAVNAAAGVLSNDDDRLTATLKTNASHGQLDFHADGSFIYTPDTGFFGKDSFSYEASDGQFVSGPVLVTLDVEEQQPCYCSGTLIATDKGEVPVENLVIGDRVLIYGGGTRNIRWIGWRSYTSRFILGRKDLLPICFEAGSIAENVPARDLWVSPHHAMYLNGVLIEAKDLVNTISIYQAEHVEGDLTYFHIELDSHDVIMAEGTWAESFMDGNGRGMFHNARDFMALYPEEESMTNHTRYYARRLDSGLEVEQARAIVEARIVSRNIMDKFVA